MPREARPVPEPGAAGTGAAGTGAAGTGAARTAAATTAALLEIDGISKRFGGIQAVSDVTFKVDAGEAVGVVGPNGAGKTTLFNCVCGQLRAETGTIRFAGRVLDGLDPYKRARVGIGRTFQRVEVFPELTAREHLVVAERARNGRGSLWRDLLNMGQPSSDELLRVAAVIELVGLGAVADVAVAALGLGTCRLVELARALVAEPRLLMADEPSSGLDATETTALAGVLRTVQQERGMGLLLVEHDLSMVGQMVDRVVVMDAGHVVCEGSFSQVMADPDVRRAYLGRGAGFEAGSGGPAGTGATPKRPVATGSDTVGDRPAAGGHGQAGRSPAAGSGMPPVAGGDSGASILAFEGVDAGYGPYRALFDVSFAVPRGGAVALLGSNGSGKSTVARVATGLVAARSGRVLFDGADVTGAATWRIARMGCAHVPEGTGVFASLSVQENLELAFARLLGAGRVADALAKVYDSFPILKSRRAQLAGTLSGGQQRILSLAKVLAEQPKLLVADELSLGLAPVVVDTVYEALAAIRAAGSSLLLVEQLPERVFEIAGSAVVLDKGVVVFSGPADGARDALEAVLGARAAAGVGSGGGGR